MITATTDRVREGNHLYERWTLSLFGIPLFRRYRLLTVPHGLATPGERQ